LLGLSSPHLQRGCFRACGISLGRCCGDSRSGGAAFEQHWRSSDRPEHALLRPQQSSFAAWLLSCWRHQLRPLLLRQPLRRRCFRAALSVHPIALSTHRFDSAVLTCSVAALLHVASALAAVALMAAPAALLSSSIGVHPIALSTQCSGSAVLICSVTAFVLVASALAAVAVTAAPAALLSSSIGRSSDRLEHVSLRLSSPHLQSDCFRACGISFGRCCLDGRSGGAGLEQPWRSSDRPTHALLRPRLP